LFNELQLQESVKRAISNMGFEEMTPIQKQAIPIALDGRDLIGQAQTGTGKTAAFGIPMVEKCTTGLQNIQGVVLAPTRELAVQVAEELNRIGQFKGIRTLPVYGGQDINRQIRALKKKPHFIVGTPGRLMDHMRRKTIRLDQVETVILDEADEMLNMGFIEDVETILKDVPTERQTMLFSATMPGPIQRLANRFMNNPEMVSVKNKEMTVPNTEQNYVEVPERQKFDALCRLLDIQSPDLAIVFGRTKRRVDELAEGLIKRGYAAEGIHGDLTQAKRDSVLRKFKQGIVEIMVATDVAARGLDITGVTHVYNFDIPQDAESYVHRIGRTGRVGKTGLAVTFVTPREIHHLRIIEQVTKRAIIRKPVPSMKDAFRGQQQLTVEKLQRTAGEEDTRQYNGLAEDLLGEFDSVALLSAALKLLTKEPDMTPIQLTEESPVSRKKNMYSKGGPKNQTRKGSGFKGYNRPNKPKGDNRGNRSSARRNKKNFAEW